MVKKWRPYVQILRLKRLSIFAYRLTINTNDRFVGLTIILITVNRDTGPVAFANSIKAGPPLEAILVIFGRRALIFFVWKLLEKMKKDATFVRMRSGDHLGDAKMSKKGTSLRRI